MSIPPRRDCFGFVEASASEASACADGASDDGAAAPSSTCGDERLATEDAAVRRPGVRSRVTAAATAGGRLTRSDGTLEDEAAVDVGVAGVTVT